MRLLFLRHAHAVSQLDKSVVVGRSSKAPLTENGRAEAQRSAEALATFQIDAIHVSPAVRTMQTAAPIAERLGLSIVQNELLIERSQGDLEGVPKSEAYPPEVERIMHADQWRWKPPNGESLEETSARLTAFFTEALRMPPNSTCLAVSHQMVAWALFRLCTGCDHRVLPKLRLENLALTEIAIESAQNPQLIRWNWPLIPEAP